MRQKNLQLPPTLPHLPGIYFFKDESGKVIYIGKAKSLNKRVRSYFQKDGTSNTKINLLINEIASIDYLVTRTEIEALLLEATVIMQEQPKFNLLLKDGQPFLYLQVTKNELPQLKIVRGTKNKSASIGPFINKTEVRRVHDFLVRTFKLSVCNKQIENGCLQYHLGLCAGTCRKDFNKEEYLFRLELARKFLKGKHAELMQNIDERIKDHSKKLEFEKAKYLSEILSSIDGVIRTIKAHFNAKKFAPDIFLKTVPILLPKNIESKKEHLAEEISQLLSLKKAPSTIDCFDISHFQSRSIVGSCIRFTNGAPDKNNFRRFIIRTLKEQNDYAALQEIVSRRYKNPSDFPDLILIDGGKGQRNAIKNLFPQVECISLAKREERAFSDAYEEGIVLDINTDTGKTLIALRDYAHHFAITFHRKRREKLGD